MSETTLRSKLIRLAHEHPETRAALLPILKSAVAPKTMDAVRFRPATARELQLHGVGAPGALVVQGILQEASSYLVGADLSTNPFVASIAEDLSKKFILRLHQVKDEAPANSTPAPLTTYVPRVIATNYSHYSTDEYTNDKDAKIECDAQGNLTFIVTETTERPYAGGHGPMTKVIHQQSIGTLTSPNISGVHTTLRRYSHTRTSLSNPFKIGWLPWDATNMWTKSSWKSLAEIISDYAASGRAQ